MVDCRNLQPPPIAPDFGGHDCEFVEEVPEHLTCIVCLGAFKDPHLLSCCGKKVCDTCITRIKNAGQACPHCRAERFNTMLDRDIERQVLNLKVYCSNRRNGCKWSNDLRQLEAHLQNCDFVDKPCKWGCGQSFIRQALQVHEQQECVQRPLELRLMTTVEKMVDQVGVLERKVADLETLCGNQREELERVNKKLKETGEEHAREMDEIRNQVKNQQVANELAIEGLRAEQKDDHARVVNLVGEQKYELDRLREQVERELPDRIERDVDLVKTSVRQVQANMEEKIRTLEDTTVYNIEMASTQIRAYTEEKFTTVASTRQLQDILERVSKNGRKVPDWQQPVPVMALTDVAPCQYTMHNFSLHKGGQKTWYSPPFYNEPGGYKFCLRVDSHGMLEGKSTHLSVWVYVMKGLHDEVLKWPFSGKITVQLLNWKTDKGHIQNIIAFDDHAGDKVRMRVTQGEVAATGRGSSRFVSHETLRGKGVEFVKDDCLCFRILKVEIV